MARGPLPPGIALPGPRRAPLPPWRVALRLAAITAPLCFFGFLPLMGLPGVLWMGLSSPIAALLTEQRLPSDSAWPMAIILSLLWPLPLAPGWWLSTLLTNRRWGRAAWTAGMILVWGLGWGTALQARYGWLG